MVELCTLASGSSGNCLAVGAAGRWVLVDAGISARRICAGLSELGAGPEDLAGILITHEHTDHIAGLAVLCRRTAAPLYASPGAAAALAEKLPQLAGRIVPVAPGAPFEAGGLEVESFPTSHDSAQSVGYALTDGLRRAVIATDLGYITPAVGAAAAGADLLVAECNHEEDWVRTGPYPPFLKSRILGDRGHLSNAAGAELACLAAQRGARAVVLAHLSRENNTPQRAWDTVCAALTAAGAEVGRDVALEVAPADRPGSRWVV